MTSTKTSAEKPKTKPAKPNGGSDPALYYMRRPGSYNGQALDREQVFQLANQRNDEAIVRLGYVAPLEGAPVTCSDCGAGFRTPGSRDAHGAKRHRAQPDRRPTMAPRQPGESDFDYDQRADAYQRAVLQAEQAEESRAERELERDAPLNWENTKATREAEL